MKNTSYDQLVSLMREVHSRPGGTGATLNLIRSAAVRAATDLAALSDLVAHPRLQLELSHHAVNEARHGHVLLQRMGELHSQPVRLPPELDRVDGLLGRCRARDVRDIYAARGTVGDAEAMELLIARYISKRGVHTELRANYDALGEDPRTQATLGSMLRDDVRHIASVEEWMRWFDRRFSPRAVGAALERLERVYAELDVVYQGALPGYYGRAVEVAERPTLRVAYAVGQ